MSESACDVTTGPPENVRDHVMAATKALSAGDWSGAFNHLAALPVWGLMPRKDEVRLLRYRLHAMTLMGPAMPTLYFELGVGDACCPCGVDAPTVPGVHQGKSREQGPLLGVCKDLQVPLPLPLGCFASFVSAVWSSSIFISRRVLLT